MKWTPSRVVNFVQKFERHGNGQTLDQFLDAHGPDNYKPYAHLDPTGEKAAWNARHHQPKGTTMAKPASVKEVAADLGISEGTVRRWLAQGRISGVRIGPKLIRLDLDQVKQELYGTAYSA